MNAKGDIQFSSNSIQTTTLSKRSAKTIQNAVFNKNVCPENLYDERFN